MCVCVQLNHYFVHLKFTQPCKYYTLILLLIILKVHVSLHSYRSQGNISVWVSRELRCVCVCVCVCETAREGEKGKNVNYLQHVCYIELDVETLEMNMTRSLF